MTKQISKAGKVNPVVIFRVRSYNHPGCRIVSHCQQQWSYSGLCSPGPSYSTLSYAFSISTLLQAGKRFQGGVAGEQWKMKKGRKKVINNCHNNWAIAEERKKIKPEKFIWTSQTGISTNIGSLLVLLCLWMISIDFVLVVLCCIKQSGYAN